MDYTGITCVPVLHKPAFYFMGALRVFCALVSLQFVTGGPDMGHLPDGGASNSCTHVFWGRGGELTYTDKYAQVVICNVEVHSPPYMKKGAAQHMVLVCGALMFLTS